MADPTRSRSRTKAASGKKPAKLGPPSTPAAHHKAAYAAGHDADAYRSHLVQQLLHVNVRFEPIGKKMALAELNDFSQTIFQYPKMRGYFDQEHLRHLQRHPDLAEGAMKGLTVGGTVEVVALPVTADRTQGFHIYRIHEPAGSGHTGVIVGYLIHSMELGGSGREGAHTIRLAYDIFPPFRHHQYEPVPFSTHEIYNVSRAAFLRWRPERFYVDAKTQIRQTVTGDPVLRAGYYLKRAYYPPDAKPLADELLVNLLARGRGSRLTKQETTKLFRQTKAPGWIYPVGEIARALPEDED